MAGCNCNSGSMCNCNISTIVLPKSAGERGLQGVPGEDGAAGPQGVAGVPGPAGSSLIVVPCVKDGLPFYSTTSSSYVSPVSFIFPGTTYFGTPTNIKVALFGSTDATCTVRINQWTDFIDLNGETTICQKDITIVSGTVIYDLGVLSNLLTTEGLFRVDIKSNNGGTVVLDSVMVKK